MTTYIKPTRIIADNAFLKRITTRAKNYQEALKGLAIEAIGSVWEGDWSKIAACLKAGGFKDFLERAGVHNTGYSSQSDDWEEERKRLSVIPWKVKREVVRTSPEDAIVQFLSKKMDAPSVKEVPGLSARIQRALDAFLSSDDEE